MADYEQICFQLITNAGTAKSNYFLAIQQAKEGNFEEVDRLMEAADQVLIEAHQIHSTLIKQEAGGNPIQMNLLLSHSEDLMMNAETVKDFAILFIDLFRNYNIEPKK